MPNISTQIAGVKLETCVFNASGPNDVTLDELELIAKSASSAITMKSCTLEPRKGNPEPRYYDLPEGSINSMGLPNLGYKEYIKFTHILKSKYNKPVVASISGLTFEDNLIIFQAFNESKADLIEFNPGSPNTIGKPTMGYDFEYLDRSLSEVTKICKNPVGISIFRNAECSPQHFANKRRSTAKSSPVQFQQIFSAFFQPGPINKIVSFLDIFNHFG